MTLKRTMNRTSTRKSKLRNETTFRTPKIKEWKFRNLQNLWGKTKRRGEHTVPEHWSRSRRWSYWDRRGGPTRAKRRLHRRPWPVPPRPRLAPRRRRRRSSGATDRVELSFSDLGSPSWPDPMRGLWLSLLPWWARGEGSWPGSKGRRSSGLASRCELKPPLERKRELVWGVEDGNGEGDRASNLIVGRRRRLLILFSHNWAGRSKSLLCSFFHQICFQ